MDLDALKVRSKSLKAPQVLTYGLNSKPQTTDDLISALKEIERKEYQQLRKAVPLWIIGFALLLFSLVVPLMAGGDVRLLPTLILKIMAVVLFAVVAILFVVKIRRLSKIDYTENVRMFLEKAEKRFTFPGREYWLFSFLLVILIAYGAHFYISDVLFRYFDVSEPWVGFGISVVFFTAVFVVGYTATRSNWNKERTPLLAEIRRMRADLGSEEVNESGM
jgi:hypothetical protein